MNEQELRTANEYMNILIHVLVRVLVLVLVLVPVLILVSQRQGQTSDLHNNVKNTVVIEHTASFFKQKRHQERHIIPVGGEKLKLYKRSLSCWYGVSSNLNNKSYSLACRGKQI